MEPFRILEGRWVAVEGKPGERVSWTEEIWSGPAKNMMVGVGRRHSNADWSQVSFEFLRIEARDDGVYYIASPGGRCPPTEFKGGPRGFCGGTGAWPFGPSRPDMVFEFANPQHDFPQRIEYWFESDDRLRVTIGGGTGDGAQQEVFHFERVR